MQQMRDDERRERARQIAAKLAMKAKERTKSEGCGVKDAPRFEQCELMRRGRRDELREKQRWAELGRRAPPFQI